MVAVGLIMFIIQGKNQDFERLVTKILTFLFSKFIYSGLLTLNKVFFYILYVMEFRTLFLCAKLIEIGYYTLFVETTTFIRNLHLSKTINAWCKIKMKEINLHTYLLHMGFLILGLLHSISKERVHNLVTCVEL